MNEVIKAIKERRSVRKYKPDLLQDEVLDEIIDALTLAQAADDAVKTGEE